jgi:hypothetical protein|tara:strand:+ start:411 stop:614 length:204 start_codon:yes stop_codon:yes gene_type:complete
MLTYSDAFERELQKIIVAEVERLLENLGHGMGVTDYANYMKIVGEIAGLRKTLEFCEEARLIVSEQR